MEHGLCEVHSPVTNLAEAGGDGCSGESTAGEEDEGNDDDDRDVSRWNTGDATTYLYGLKVRHNISDTAFAAMWDGFRKVLPVLQPSSRLPSARTLKRTVLRDIPEMLVDVAYFNKETKETAAMSGLQHVPKKKYEDRSQFKPLYEVWRTKLEDAVKFHHSSHCANEEEIILNIDGVPIGRTGRSQTIVSVKFVSCKNVYQLTNAIAFCPEGKAHLSLVFILGDVLQCIMDLNLSLLYICADAPMRALLRNQKTHTSKLGCDYCYGEAGHKGRPIWGVDTLESKERTRSSVLEDYEKVANGENTYANFGYKGRCIILDTIPHFDMINQIPVDPMHMLFLGIGRALFELLFKVGENRPTNLTSPRQSTRGMDNALEHVKVPRELPRRPRPMDFKNWKGAEWRNLILFYFPIVAEILHPGARQQVWLEYCFLCRAYSIPDMYFNALDHKYLQSLAKKWYLRYFRAFGPLNMRYNVHLMAHLHLIRVHGPFPEISAFPFEGSFAVGGRAQRIGTSSLGLQFMRHSYLRPLNGHNCERKITYSVATTSRRQDDLLYSEKCIYQLVENPKPEDHFLKVTKVNATTYFAPGAQHLDFTSVGVFKFISVASSQQYLRLDKVLGKVIRVPLADDDILVTISNAQLREAD